MKKIFCLLFLCVLLFGLAGGASAVMITFNEAGAPTGQLEGTTFYDAFGASFESSLQIGYDSRLPDDGYGITNNPGTTGTVNFINPASNIQITWAVVSPSITIFLELYDLNMNLLDSFSGSPSTGYSGTYSFLGSGVSRLLYHDSGAQVAIDTLSFSPVPEPSTMLLLGVGLIGLAGATRRKLKK